MTHQTFDSSLLHPRYWLLWIVLGLWFLVVQLPYPVLCALALPLSWVLRLGRSRKHIVEVNLRLCFPQLSERERRKLLDKNFYSLAMALFETGMAWFWPKWRLRRLYRVTGLEHLPEHPEQGIVLMALHFTTLDIGAAMLSQERNITGMYRPHKNRLYDFIQRRGRERHSPGFPVIPRDDVRGMLRALKKNDIVWYAPDQDYGRQHSVFVPLFGVDAATVTTTSRFARTAKALVVPFVQHRLPRGRGYSITVYPPLQDFPVADEEQNALRINQYIEARISEQPEQYLWAHRRFKTGREGKSRLYD